MAKYSWGKQIFDSLLRVKHYTITLFWVLVSDFLFLTDVIKTKPAFIFLFLIIQNKNSLQKNYNGIKQGTKERGKFY